MANEIRINGHLDGHSVGLVRRSPGQLRSPGRDDITGRVADQATPHGLPAKVRNPGLELLQVRRTDPS